MTAAVDKAPFPEGEKQVYEQSSVASRDGRMSDVELADYFEENVGSALCFHLPFSKESWTYG